ncbi:hypothetical protein, partial [Sansalvadorimonas verongulae]|uniref:hypothetical protein n=1 Tax=Sansalvadorimonas verongulae TaxID=2172824 RepID=UPI0018AD0FB1
ALGRLLQVMGGTDDLKAALDIFTRLRTRAAGGVANTPCEDRDIELALGRLFQVMGGTDNLQVAWDIYTRLRTRATGGVADIPSENKEIELGLASVFTDLGAWRQFDGLQLDKQLFSGFETCLYLSIRYFQELMDVEKVLPEHLSLLGKAFHWAALAVEGSGGTNASCLSQLAHCFRLLSAWPPVKLRASGIEEKREHEFKLRSDLLFAKANDLAPHRQEQKKDERWRLKERQFLAHMTA